MTTGTCPAAALSSVVLALVAGALIGATSTPLAAQQIETAVERQVLVMGTRARLAVDTPDRTTALRQLDRMLRALESTEAELSTWRDTSLLSRLNRQPLHQPWRAPDRLCRVFETIYDWHQKTGGAFDPAIGTLVEAWGIRHEGRTPGAGELAAARNRSGLQHVAFDAGSCTIRRRADVAIDAGAFGKGAALERVLTQEVAANGAPWLIDLGGQVAVSGDPPGRGWPVGLAHPIRRADAVLELVLHEGSIAVSGGSERDHQSNGVRVGHLLDPQTGRPVHRRASVAVWHERPLVADIVSTALFIMGPETGVVWADHHGIAACFLMPDDNHPAVTVRASAAFRQRFLR